MQPQLPQNHFGHSAGSIAPGAPSLNDSSGVSQDPARQLTSTYGRVIVGARGSLMITLNPEHLGLQRHALRLPSRGNGALCTFSAKREAHITLSGFNRELQAILLDPARSDALNCRLRELNGELGVLVAFVPASPIKRIEKTYKGVTKDGKVFEEYREALIREVSCEKIEEILARVGELLSSPLTPPYLFVTLYSAGSGHNIAVPNRNSLTALNPIDLPGEQLALFQVSGAEQGERIGAFLKIVDQMRKERCAQSTDFKVSPSRQLGEELLMALVGPNPIERLADLIEQPGIASVLHKILALRSIPYPQKPGVEMTDLEHTLRVVAEASRLCIERNLSDESKKAVMLAALLQDLGRGEVGITKRQPDGSGGTRIVCHGYEKAGERPAREILRALGLCDFAPAVVGFVEHQAALPARYEKVLSKEMTRECCVERTSRFLNREYRGLDPEIFLVSTIATLRGAKVQGSDPRGERFIEGIIQIFDAAKVGRRGDGR
jgi:hypothetical protein